MSPANELKCSDPDDMGPLRTSEQLECENLKKSLKEKKNS